MNTHQRTVRLDVAHFITNGLNPFFVFTALYALVALWETNVAQAILYLGVELVAAVFVAGYVFRLRRQRRVGDFWISARAERVMPSLLLLLAFVVLLGALLFLGAPEMLFLTTFSMGLASTAVAATTLVWKASAHSAVAGHAAMASLIVLGLTGLVFAIVLLLVLWSRVASGVHTLPQGLAGAGIGAALAFVLLT